MTTLTSWLALAAVLIFVGGVAFFTMRTGGRVRRIGLAATVAVTVAVAWYAWYAGITPAGA
jgi:hypothetical protein